jgi:hypothetical protein
MVRIHDGVLFVDAGHSYQHGKLPNVLLDSDVEAIEAAYFSSHDSSRLKRLVARDEIAANDSI